MEVQDVLVKVRLEGQLGAHHVQAQRLAVCGYVVLVLADRVLHLHRAALPLVCPNSRVDRKLRGFCGIALLRSIQKQQSFCCNACKRGLLAHLTHDARSKNAMLQCCLPCANARGI